MASREQMLDRFGATLAISIHSGIIINILAVGIQLFMCLYILSMFLYMPKERRKGRTRFVIISFLIFVFYTVTTGLEASTDFEVLYSSQPTGLSYIYRQAALWSNRSWWVFLHDHMALTYQALGDGLMVWRCYVLLQHGKWKWLTFFPFLTALGFIITSSCVSLLTLTNETIRRLIITYIMLSVGTNIQVTALITWRLFHSRRSLAHALPGNHASKMYAETTAVLIESAAPLAVFGVGAAVVVIVRLHATPHVNYLVQARFVIADFVISSIYYAFCALSPQMIIFRVMTGHSWKNAQETRGELAPSQPLAFAKGVGDSSGGTIQTDGVPSEEQMKRAESA